MEIEIVTIGDEVLQGYTLNTNASFIASQLVEHGFLPTRHFTIGDEPLFLKKNLLEMIKRGAIVIATGGLGPTCDDWTRKVVSEIFEVPLEPRADLTVRLKKLFGDVSTLPDQILQPKGAFLFENDLGTASGFVIRDEKRFPGALFISMPGVPSEMKQMLLQQVLPYLKKHLVSISRTWTKVFHYFSLVEADIDPTLRHIQSLYPHVQCSIYPAFSTVTVHLTTVAGVESEAEALLLPAEELLHEQFGAFQYQSESGRLDEAVHRLLIEKKVTVATAESCTGGALAATFVSKSDASLYFQGSVVAYSNAIKTKILEVNESLLETYGAVSEQVTEKMAKQVRQLILADCGIAISGIFGPKGGTVQKPVGTVCVSISLQDRPVHSWTMHLQGNRQVISEKAIQRTLVELFLLLLNPK